MREVRIQPTSRSGAGTSPTAVLSTSQNSSHESIGPEDQLVSSGHAIDICQLMTERWFGSSLVKEPRRRIPNLRGQYSISSRSHLRPQARKSRPNPLQSQQPNANPASSREQQIDSHQLYSSASTTRDTDTKITAGENGQQEQQQQRQQKTYEQQNAILAELPGIGTWAGRQRLFERPQRTPLNPISPAVSLASDMKASSLDDDNILVNTPTSTNNNKRPVPNDDDGFLPSEALPPGSNASAEEAWRWRFQRKWQQEQLRTLLPREDSFASAGEDDEDALRYCQAVGVGTNLQILPQRTTFVPHSIVASMTNNPLQSSTSNASLCFDVDASFKSDMLSMEATSPASATPLRSTTTIGGAGGGTATSISNGSKIGHVPSATKHVLKVASRAQDLLAQQAEVEKKEKERWEESCQYTDTWAGALIPPVRIDMYGNFVYIILRVSDSAGHQRFLVRGHNHASQATLAVDATNELTAACRLKGCPLGALEVVGAGRMEWRADTERHLHLSPALIVGKEQQGGKYFGDVTRLTASLVQGVLPCHFQISTKTGSSPRNSLSSAVL